MEVCVSREVSLVMLKPGASELIVPVFAVSIAAYVKGLIAFSKLEIDNEQDRILAEKEIVTLYAATINKPEIPKIQSQEFTQDLVNYMTSGSSKIITVSGEKAILQCVNIKRVIRSLSPFYQCTNHIRNLIHAPDPCEVLYSLSSLSR